VTGDTRFDQVIMRARTANREGPLLAPLRSNRPTLVVGSSWPADERQLLPAIGKLRRSVPSLRVIVAPHEPSPEHIVPIERWAATVGRHTRLGGANAGSADIVIVDRVGVLGELYALADFAFVGGGFHAAGLHSILEPAAYGVPVMFGPRHDASRDAALLLEKGGALTARDEHEIFALLRGWLDDRPARLAAGTAARRVVEENAGAAGRSLALLESLLGATGKER
jgi:3-deoxy-D-manno-octulosonic-acid transferase